jgi:hypothetical protein
MALTLTRPNGTVASHINGTGGSLTLTYSASRQEIDAAKAANHIKWKVEISRSAHGTDPVSGKLSISYPWEPVTIVLNKSFKVGPLGNVPVNQYTHSEHFTVLGPGTIRIAASWTPIATLSASLVQNTVGAVAQKNTGSPFQVAHHVAEQNLNVPAWSCTFQNLSQQPVVGNLNITFVPDH